MAINRYFIEDPLLEKKEVILSGEEYKHLQVMRNRPKEQVELINGKGKLAKATLLSLEKKQAHLEITDIFSQDPPPYKICLAQAYLKPNRLDFVLEKGTELGVTEFWLYPCQNSLLQKLSPSYQKRALSLTLSATKQCNRLYLPTLIEKPSLDSLFPFSGKAYFGDLNPKAPSLDKVFTPQDSLFLIGPEKGFSEKEIINLEKKAQGVFLHLNQLRAETAAIAAVSLLSNFLSFLNR